jgi:hypothetical protein
MPSLRLVVGGLFAVAVTAFFILVILGLWWSRPRKTDRVALRWMHRTQQQRGSTQSPAVDSANGEVVGLLSHREAQRDLKRRRG